MQTNEDSTASGFLRLPQVLALIPVSRSTWWAWVRKGWAPPAIQLGPNTTAWRTSDVKDFMDMAVADAEGGAGKPEAT